MDYENLYKESLERAKKLHKDAITLQLEQDIKDYEYIFPVLKESEDEKIRKVLIDMFKGYNIQKVGDFTNKEIIAWLEKQGEQKPNDKDTIQSYSFYSYKGEPDFKVGDWIVSNVSHEDYRICKILKIENDEYVIESIYGYQGHNNFEAFDKDYHHWTIQDAKDGDVLAFYSEYKGNKMVQVGIIEKYIGRHGGCSNSFKTYVGVNWENNLQLGKYMGCSDIHPATKEQRDLLFQKMKEAGYEWDSEKKKLKKIHVIDDGKDEMDYCFTKMMNGEKINPTWSEEDGRKIGTLSSIIFDYAFHKDALDENNDLTGEYAELDNWLQSFPERIQPQWKPSDKQICMLEDAVKYLDSIGAETSKIVLEDLLEQLKKL